MIYLDHAATTPLRPAVAAVMEAAGREGFANPSSQHAAGRRARQILEDARERILAAIGCRTTGPDRYRLVFTSGATEANRLAVVGMGRAARGAVAVSARDHESLRAAAASLATRPGWNLSTLPLDSQGRLDPAAVSAWLADTSAAGHQILCTTLVCGQTGSRESPLLVGPATEPRCLVHSDATQAVAFTSIDMPRLGVATLALAPTSLVGPGGLAASWSAATLTLNRSTRALRNRHAGGTEPVALAAGFATAIELACAERVEVSRHLAGLRDRFEAGMVAAAERRGLTASVLGGAGDRSPHLSTIGFAGRDRQAIVMAADLAGLCCATGTACASGSSEPAPALAAMGLPEPMARGAVRFSFGNATAAAEIDRAIALLEGLL